MVFPFLSTLCGNRNDTISCPRAINGTGGSILEYLYIFYVIRIQIIDISNYEPIYNIQRVGIIDCSCSAYFNSGSTTRCACILDNIHTSCPPLKRLQCRRNWYIIYFLARYGRNRTCNIALSLYTIANDYKLFELFSFWTHFNICLSPPVYCYLFVSISHISEQKICFR